MNTSLDKKSASITDLITSTKVDIARLQSEINTASSQRKTFESIANEERSKVKRLVTERANLIGFISNTLLTRREAVLQLADLAEVILPDCNPSDVLFCEEWYATYKTYPDDDYYMDAIKHAIHNKITWHWQCVEASNRSTGKAAQRVKQIEKALPAIRTSEQNALGKVEHHQRVIESLLVQREKQALYVARMKAKLEEHVKGLSTLGTLDALDKHLTNIIKAQQGNRNKAEQAKQKAQRVKGESITKWENPKGNPLSTDVHFNVRFHEKDIDHMGSIATSKRAKGLKPSGNNKALPARQCKVYTIVNPTPTRF